MKFAIRDDDVNFHFSKEYLESALCNVTKICPVTLSVVPYVQGDWGKNTKLLEHLGSNNITQDVISEILSDDKIYKIDDNIELMEYLKDSLKNGMISIAQHGVHHRNNDKVLPLLTKNYSIGAEFFTDRDLTQQLANSNYYLNNIFNSQVDVFTPPQNALSEKGYHSIINNNMNVCGYLPSVKNFHLYMRYFNFEDYCKIFKHQLSYRKTRRPYPFSVRFGRARFIEHVSLQPKSSIGAIIDAINYVGEKDGDFVLSTHTYGFGTAVDESGESIEKVLIDILEYVKKEYNPKFVTLNEILNT